MECSRSGLEGVQPTEDQWDDTCQGCLHRSGGDSVLLASLLCQGKGWGHDGKDGTITSIGGKSAQGESPMKEFVFSLQSAENTQSERRKRDIESKSEDDERKNKNGNECHLKLSLLLEINKNYTASTPPTHQPSHINQLGVRKFLFT